MNDSYQVFEIFNRIEACIWFSAAIGLLFFIKWDSKRQLASIRIATFGFVLFGITDLLEAPTHGLVPAWLWVFKITTATLLLGCRVIYVGRKNFRLTDRWLVFGVICLVISACIIWMGE